MHSTAWDRFYLNSLITRSLVENNFTSPTDIQNASLPYHQYKTDLILASKTGSGKTLCFGIPILSDLVNELGLDSEFDGETEINAPRRKDARALIITPTRELAIQIMHHFERINQHTKKYIKIGVIVGGLSKEKQLRILSRNPQIVIATPGRLWDIIEEESSPFLKTLKKINFLVLDEADKMIELGHFKELDKILSYIYSKETGNTDKFKENEEADLLEDLYIRGPGGKMISLKDPSLNLVRASQNADQEGEEEEGEEEGQNEETEEFHDEEVDEDEVDPGDEDEYNQDEGQNYLEEEEEDEEDQNNEYLEEEAEEQDQDEVEENGDEEEEHTTKRKSKKKKADDEPVFRRTIVLSATLANSEQKETKGKNKRQRKGRGKDKGRSKSKGKSNGKDTAKEGTSMKLEMLMKKIQFNGKPKLIDLTQDSKLPETLKEYKCVCTDEQKIIYIYSFLRRNADKSFIIFTNTIPAAKRVYSILLKLGIKAVCLHSEMQQRQRLRKLEKFAKNESPVLVCTDVASRGLDIPSVNFVIHYQIPKDSDTYVHRSGRTARIGREGVAYALVAPGDKANYLNICKQLRDGQGIDTIQLSKIEMDKVTEMVEAATKLEKGEFFLEKQKKETEWFEKNSKQADILLDEEIENQIEDVKEEISKKRKIMTKNKINYQKIKQNTGQKMINPNKSKSVFLDSSQIANIAALLANKGSQKGTPTNNRNDESFSSQGRSRSKSKHRRHK